MFLCLFVITNVFFLPSTTLALSLFSEPLNPLPSTPLILPTTFPILSTNTSTATNATSLSVPAACFNQPGPPFPRLNEIHIEDCYAVLFEILRWESSIIPVLWDRQARGFPIWNVQGSCAVGIFAKYLNSKDVFPEILVAQRAARVVELCVRLTDQRFRLGGKIDVGARNDFFIAVYGRDANAGGEVGVPGFGPNGTAVA